MPFVPLALDTFPFLVSATSRMQLEWNYGPMFTVLLTSKYVRISEHGVQWCTLCEAPALQMSEFPFLNLFSRMRQWQSSFACVPTKNALCTSTGDPKNVITMFPTNKVDVALEKHPFVDAHHGCHSQTANRNIATVHQDYQVSLCDIVHSHLEFVFDNENAVMYWRHNEKPFWWNLLVTLSCLFFFTRVCEHLTLLVHGQRRKFSLFTTTMIIGMLILSRVLQAIGVLTQHLVTAEELTLNLILEFYCYLYVLAQLFTCATSDKQYTQLPDETNIDSKQSVEQSTRDISTLGTLVAVQLILTAHLHNTYENPFLGILTLLFGTRAFLKFMNFTLNHTGCHRSTATDWMIARKLLFLIVDTGTLACVFEFAVRISMRNEMEYASTATGMLFIIVLGGTFLHTVIQTWNARIEY